MDFTNKTIGEIVAEDFRTAAIFKKHGIDFCCRGGRTIEEACEKKKVMEQQLIDELSALPSVLLMAAATMQNQRESGL